ncbi:MAG: hypothetical protein ABH835_05170 [Patescibacteria group bacterium]
MKIIKNNKGYVALILVLIVASVALAVGISISLSGISEVKMAFSETQSEKAYNYALSCQEEALNYIKSNWESYNSTLNFADGTCTLEISVGFGNGSDGALSVAGETTIDDVKRPLANGNYGAGEAEENKITISNAAGEGSFSVDDDVLLIQMNNNDFPNNLAGQYEEMTISGINGDEILFDENMGNSYIQDGVGEKVQVIRIPQYTNVTIVDGATLTTDGWDGNVGGILAFKANNNLNFEGSGQISVVGKGYRGGSCGNCGFDAWGQCGEGITGVGSGGGATPVDNYEVWWWWPHTFPDTGSNGGAGGYYRTLYLGTAGGGGSNVTVGGEGIDFLGAIADFGNDLSYDLSNKLIFGGGGGGGGGNNGVTPNPDGGAGGGTAYIYAQYTNNANITAKGGAGVGRSGSIIGAVGGGGAGGDIFLRAATLTTNIMDISGGAGGQDTFDAGGAGGEGGLDATTTEGNAIKNVIGTATDDTGSYVRKIEIEADSDLNIINWQELTN